jgi:pectin methylesterase-like acyl-CoA thioesterase
MKMTVSALLLIITLISVAVPFHTTKLAKTEPATIIVPDNFLTIQGAVNSANDGDTIFVRAGKYYENLWIHTEV